MTQGSSGAGAGPELLEVGTIAKAHGLRGEVIVSLVTDRVERLDPGTVLETDRGPLTVVSAAPHQHRWRVQFLGVASREAAESLHGLALRAAPIDDPDELWVHDLLGAEVVTADGSLVGTCVAVLDNPAHDILELDTGVLVPVVFVTSTEPGRVTVELPDGLLDL